MPNLDRRSGRLESLMSDVAADVDRMLDRLLPDGSGEVGEARLAEAMRYMALGGGKRFRAFLVVESSKLFKVSPPAALQVAAAVEMLHTYSLIHDDLPAMDDAELRRGRLTIHRMYDEATAILAGDALLTRAFEVLADPAVHGDSAVRIELVKELAQAAGTHGMCGGQMMDLQAECEALPLEIGAITRLQRLKTGMIIAFSCEAGAILGKAAPGLRRALNAYAHDLGLAFQIADDLLDLEGSSVTMGKATGKDNAANKVTFVSILGVERARAQAKRLVDQACQHLEVFEASAKSLYEVARFVIERKC